MFAKLSTLHPSVLRDLAGEILLGAREPAIRKLLGFDKAQWLSPIIHDMIRRGWSCSQLSEALAGMALAAENRPEPHDLLELVITNPVENDSPARDTRAVMLSLFEQAQKELLIVGYTLHKSASLLQPLAEKMQANPELKVWFCLDLKRPHDASKSAVEDHIELFAHEFHEKHWPWRPLPEVWLDIRNWQETSSESRSLHAKCIVVDRAQAFITSANLTEAAQYRNIEAGVLIRDTAISRRLAVFFDHLCVSIFHRLAEPTKQNGS